MKIYLSATEMSLVVDSLRDLEIRLQDELKTLIKQKYQERGGRITLIKKHLANIDQLFKKIEEVTYEKKRN